jgi:hypothetical protein
MYIKSFRAMVSAARLLLERRGVLLMLLLAWVALLASVYLFASTREATIAQLLLTLVVVIAAPALFFVLQAVSVTYAGGASSAGRMKKLMIECLRLIVVTLPVVAVTLLAVYGLNKVQTYLTLATTLRYLLIGVIAPMLAIQLWIATTSSGLRPVVKGLRHVLSATFAPQSVFVYGCGFLIFAVTPYVLLQVRTPITRPWFELSVLILRLVTSATLILLGWVTTVGALSILKPDQVIVGAAPTKRRLCT